MTEKGTDVVLAPQGQAVQIRETVASIKARVQLVQQVRKDLMKKDVHFGRIPGTDKDTLYKPGAELIALAFQFAPRHTVEDLSDFDVVRYRVRCELWSRETGAFVGEGQGEASSNEEKYRWRRAANDAEFEATPEDRRRVKYGHNGKTGKDYTINQVRIEPADIANTVLKMGEKRALIDAVRTASACSDMFAQDLEDLPQEVSEGMADGKAAKKARPLGEEGWQKLVADARGFGYTEEDIVSTAAVAGYEGPGAEMPRDLGVRLFRSMRDHPRTQVDQPGREETEDTIDAEADEEDADYGRQEMLQ